MKKNKNPNVKCTNCNKKIHRYPHQLKKYKMFFCNMGCQNDFKKRKVTSVIINCNYCGEQVFRNKNQRRSSKTGLFFCNNLCKNKYLAKNKRWKKDNVNSHQQRKNIFFEKANNTCQKCGYNENKKMLDIHHYDHNHKNNRCDNLRVLCSWCHTKHHRLKEKYDISLIINYEDMEKEIIEFHKKRKEKAKRKEYKKICLFCKEKFITFYNKQNCCSCNCSNMKSRKVKNRPSKEKILQEVEETNYCVVGRKYGVSDSAIRKWLR